MHEDTVQDVMYDLNFISSFEKEESEFKIVHEGRDPEENAKIIDNFVYRLIPIVKRW